MVDSYFEVTLIDVMSQDELDWLAAETERYGWDMTMNASGRILVIEGPDNVEDLIGILGPAGFADDVGHIRQITDYTVERELIALEFEN